jgi:proton-coupled amino acid transporter
MVILLVPILAICSIRRLRVLAPFSFAANIVYLVAVAIVAYYFFTHLQPSENLVKFGSVGDLPFFFGTVMFAFEGVSIVSLPIKLSKSYFLH